MLFPAIHKKTACIHRMKHSSILLLALLIFPLSGCNKHNILIQEREKLDSEREAIQVQIAELDRTIQGMPDAFNIAALQRKLEEVEKKSASVEAEASAKMKKWEYIESRFLPLKKQAEDYRAKNNL